MDKNTCIDTCIARVWKNGDGGQCSRAGLYDPEVGYFCKTHRQLYIECVENDCTRGIKGLGGCWICPNIHDGLWLGFIKNTKPLYNQNGLLLPWKEADYTYNSKKNKKRKNKKRKNKKVLLKIKPKYYNSIMKSKGKKSIMSTLKKTMNSLDLDSPLCTPDYIISVVEKKLEKTFLEKEIKKLYKKIDKIYEDLIEKELSPSSSDDEDCGCIDDLCKIIVGGEEYLQDRENYNVFTNSKKPRYIGFYNSDGSITFD